MNETWDQVSCGRCGQTVLNYLEQAAPFVCAGCKLIEVNRKASLISTLAVGADELGEALTDLWDCCRCGEVHEVKSSSRDLLQFVKCSGTLYVVGVQGQTLLSLTRRRSVHGGGER